GFVIYFTLLMALTSYLRKFGQSRLRLMRSQVGVLLTVGATAAVAKLLLLFTAFPEYWIPVAAVPLWIATAFDRRAGVLVSVVLAFVVASFLRFDLLLLATMLAQALGATLTYLDRKRSRHMLLSGAMGGVSAAAVLVALTSIVEGKFDFQADFEKILD